MNKSAFVFLASVFLSSPGFCLSPGEYYQTLLDKLGEAEAPEAEIRTQVQRSAAYQCDNCGHRRAHRTTIRAVSSNEMVRLRWGRVIHASQFILWWLPRFQTDSRDFSETTIRISKRTLDAAAQTLFGTPPTMTKSDFDLIPATLSRRRSNTVNALVALLKDPGFAPFLNEGVDQLLIHEQDGLHDWQYPEDSLCPFPQVISPPRNLEPSSSQLQQAKRLVRARIAEIPEEEQSALDLAGQSDPKITAIARAHLGGACLGTQEGLRFLDGFSKRQISVLVKRGICGPPDDLPDPKDFLKGPLGKLAGMIGQFQAQERSDGVHIVGLGGLVDQRVEKLPDGSWEQNGSLRTPLPCAQAIHNAATRKRTPSPKRT
jgi:hypothetical protein